MDSIGYRISKARRHMNIKQKELAQRANITEGSLSRYENDIREPKAAALIQIADALNVSTDYLLGISDEMEVRPTLADKTDVQIDDMINQFSDDLIMGNVLYDGEPVTKDVLDSVITAMKVGVRVVLEEHKNKRKK